MKSIVKMVGVILIILGIVSFSYKYFTYKTDEQVAQIGNVQVTTEEEKMVFISPLLSGVIVIAGIVLVLIGRRK